MRDRQISHFSRSVDKLAADWALKIVLLSIVVIVVSTLYPFKFTLPDSSPAAAILHKFNQDSSFLDIVANIILFSPLGFGLGSQLAQRQYSAWSKLLIVTLLSGGFSLLIEILQVFLPGRMPTPLDVVSNTLGGVFGFGVFQFYGNVFYTIALHFLQRTRHLLAKISLKYLVITLVIYVGFASWLVFSWQGSSLKSWHDGFPLSIGNNYSSFDADSNQQLKGAWNGSVADVVILDHALERSQVEGFLSELTPFSPKDPSVIAAYSLRGEQGEKDLVGQSPDLVWQGKSATMSSTAGASLSADHWLQTAEPLKFVTKRIRDTSQFTISALIQTHDIDSAATNLQQIISIATPTGIGNFSISQIDSSLNLVISVRRINRSSKPYMQRIYGVFQDQKPHRFVITYSGFVARVYVDGSEQAYFLDMTPNRFQIMLYLLILVPLAFLVGMIANRTRHHLEIYLVIVGLGTVTPALLLEVFLAGEGDRTIRLANLLLGMLITGGTILAVKGSFQRPRRMMTSSS